LGGADGFRVEFGRLIQPVLRVRSRHPSGKSASGDARSQAQSQKVAASQFRHDFFLQIFDFRRQLSRPKISLARVVPRADNRNLHFAVMYAKRLRAWKALKSNPKSRHL
jgi:hypothetical protein